MFQTKASPRITTNFRRGEPMCSPDSCFIHFYSFFSRVSRAFVFVLVIWVLVIWICLKHRDFGFHVTRFRAFLE